MKGTIEGRLAKLEASTSAGDEAPEFIFAMNEKGETREEFDRRCEQLEREVPGYPDRQIFFFQLITRQFITRNGRPSQ